MSVIATALKHLIAAGMSGDALVAAVADLERALAVAVPVVDPQAVARRERDAERKRIVRADERAERLRTSAESADSADKADAAPSLDKEAPQTPKEIKPIPCVGIAPARGDDPGLPPVLRLSLAIATLEAVAALRTRRWRGMPPPPGVSEIQWAGFLDHRRAKRETLTPRAFDLLCGKLAKLAEDGWPPGEMIDRAVERGWLTVFPPDEDRNGKRTAQDRGGTSENRNPLVRAAAAREARRSGERA